MLEVGSRVRELLGHATGALRSAGITAPGREARWMAESVWGVGGGGVELLLGNVGLDAPMIERYQAAVARRAGGEPLAYVTGHAEFRHLTLHSDPRALIPRPETEGLVDLALERVPSGRAVDIGTGSGAIALSLAGEGAYRSVVATDRSPGALDLAGENRALTGLPISLVRADLVAPLADEVFDLLVSNPPYLTAAEGAALDPSVRDWEPVEALVSGADGLDATRQLLEEGQRVLRRGGWIVLELDCSRAATTARLASSLGWVDVALVNDLFQRARYLVARRSDCP
jgi:release factor glutamine methyltransferase